MLLQRRLHIEPTAGIVRVYTEVIVIHLHIGCHAHVVGSTHTHTHTHTPRTITAFTPEKSQIFRIVPRSRECATRREVSCAAFHPTVLTCKRRRVMGKSNECGWISFSAEWFDAWLDCTVDVVGIPVNHLIRSGFVLGRLHVYFASIRSIRITYKFVTWTSVDILECSRSWQTY